MRKSEFQGGRRAFLMLVAGAFSLSGASRAGAAAERARVPGDGVSSLPGSSGAGAATEGVHACGHHAVTTGGRRAVPHPDPRPGIDGSLVLTRDQLGALPESVKVVYDMVREIPQIADGLGCNCGCSALPSYRSLLTCFYENRMAVGCNICQGEAKLAYRRHKEGQSLAQIRRAIDARFG